MALSRLPSLSCTPITSDVLPPLPAARMASAPSSRSFSESTAQPLAICGQAKPWTLYLLQNLTSFWRQSRSSLSACVTGVWPMGNTPRSGFDGAAESLPASDAASAAPPSVCMNSLRPESCDWFFMGFSLALAVNSLQQFVERVAVDWVAEAGFGGREHVAFFIDAELGLVRAVRRGHGMRHLKPISVGHS